MKKEDPRPYNNKRFAVLLRRFADVIDKSTVKEVDALLSGSSTLHIVDTNNKPKNAVSRRQKVLPKGMLSDATNKLRSFSTRQQGLDFLNEEFPTKLSVERLVRFLDLPVFRTDTIEILYEKIVEAEIGSKLRSEAVRGKEIS